MTKLGKENGKSSINVGERETFDKHAISVTNTFHHIWNVTNVLMLFTISKSFYKIISP